MTEAGEMDAASLVLEKELFDVVVIGGGSAGLAAASAAAECGADVVLIERERYLGGVLPQCVHDGFGLHLYGQSLTGPEYAERWAVQAVEAGVEVLDGTTVLDVARGADGTFELDCIGEAIDGRRTLRARAVVVATGCRERTRGQLLIPGTRPAGVLTAGTAQYMMNVENQLPGDKVVVLGSGDIGLIMARRFTLEGAEVRLVLGQEATGLLRNHIRCIRDFDIPIRYGWGVARIHGSGRLSGVTVAPYLQDGTFDMSQSEYVRCNVLLLACGLIPERETVDGFDMDSEGRSIPAGLFLCGNAKAPCDLVDEVTQDGIVAGRAAAEFASLHGGGSMCSLPDRMRRIVQRTIGERKGKLSDLKKGAESAADYTVCTVCPTGCVVRLHDDGSVEGATCERGCGFALQEAVEPLRVFTGTVKVSGSDLPLVPVRTDREVPLSALRDVSAAARRTRVKAPVHIGDVLIHDVAHTGADLVATASRSDEDHHADR